MKTFFLRPASFFRPYEDRDCDYGVYDLTDLASWYPGRPAYGVCPLTGVGLRMETRNVMGRLFYRVAAFSYAQDGSDLAAFTRLHGRAA